MKPEMGTELKKISVVLCQAKISKRTFGNVRKSRNSPKEAR